MAKVVQAWLIPTFCVATMLSLLSGCALYAGGGGGGGEGGGGTITFLHWRGEDQRVFGELADGFEEETGIRVEQSVLPSDAYTAQSQQRILSGGGADVFTTQPGSQFRQLSDAGAYVDLTDAEFTGRFDERFIESGRTQDGRQLALPYQLVFNIPVYNVRLLEGAGFSEPPADWEGFLSLCDALKEQNVAPIAFAGNVSASQFINPMLMNNQPSDDIWQQVEAGEAQVTEDWYVETLSQIAELRDRGCFQDDPLGSTAEGTSALFAQEEAGMIALGSYQMATVAEQNPDVEQNLLAPITVPADEARYDGIYSSTFMLGVNAKGQNQEAARQWIEFLTRPENASTYANGTGQLLTLNDIDYTTEILQTQQPWQEKRLLFQPRYELTIEEIDQGMRTSVEDILSGSSPEEAAQRFQSTIDRAIQE